jgi:cellulose synthase/poly-beta-1,6-N-acetylglucosamine synthase-like glycosyltransferase
LLSLSEPLGPDGFFEHLNWGGNLTPGVEEVLPRLQRFAIADALRRLPEEELAVALRTKILPMVTLPGLRLFAVFGEAAKTQALDDGLRLIAEGTPADFLAAAREALGPSLIKAATQSLAKHSPALSAHHRFSEPQAAVLWVLLTCGMVAVAIAPVETLLVALGLAGGLVFLPLIALRILSLLPLPPAALPEARPLTDAALPVYTILVPLFRETSVLGQLLHGLTAIDYPAHKLDIKLILEESDILMQRAVFGLRLPEQFDCLVVPSGLPQTKPRALNYALQFARGELLTIFDAEDLPEPRQLRAAAGAFAVLSEDTACLQAELSFYNPNENWLTRQFTVEYASLFGVLLPALSAHDLPFPLGGTSNHFRVSILRQVGAWDPYNVTEDADLGLRLARSGYDSATLAAHTYEEANTRLWNWLRQRARWLKGFLQTWLVHMRHPTTCFTEVGPAGFWVTQTMTMGVFLSALLHPFGIAIVVWPWIGGGNAAASASMIDVFLAGLSLLVLATGYGVSMAAGVVGLRRLGIRGWWFTILTMPFYWLLMSVAAWMGLWQFIVAPSHWNKTHHGLSKHQQRRAKRR